MFVPVASAWPCVPRPLPQKRLFCWVTLKLSVVNAPLGKAPGICWIYTVQHNFAVYESVLRAFLFKLSSSKCNSRQQFDAREELKHLVFFLPFVTPVKNIYYAIRLYMLRFGMRDFEAKNAKEVERIQHQAGSAGMYESFLESGPQCVFPSRWMSSLHPA